MSDDARDLAPFRSALRALGETRRLVPLLGVLAALLVTEALATRSGLAIALDAGLFALFALVAPGAYRALSPRGGVGLAIYTSIGLTAVLGFGALVSLVRASWTYVIDPGSLLVLVVLFLVGGWGLGRDMELEARAEARALEAERNALAAQRNALMAEQNALLAQKAQLDPHFLFNVLNAIAEWCRHDPAIAEAATLKLASMLRSVLDGVRAPSWPLATEIALARQLADLYAVRDRSLYRFRFELPDPVPAIEVPPLLLLPMVENAITHGPGAGHEGEVSIRLLAEGAGARLVVENGGPYRGRREGGSGLAILERRLALAYPAGASFVIRAEGEGTIAELVLPAHAGVLPRAAVGGTA